MSGLDILHVDMDCFFAAVEVLDEPSLSGRAVIVGGTGHRGVVASCSYEARVSGVRSAMPMAEARRRCPGAAFLPGRHDRYGEVSRELHAVFAAVTPVIEPIALDEAFLDVSGCHRLFGPSEAIAHEVRRRVLAELRLDCSVGVARTKLIAKLASRAAKPVVTTEGPRPGSGVVVVTAGEELDFLQPRPVRDLWGVGPRTAERLARFGVTTIHDLAALDESAIVRIVGSTAVGRQLHALAWGRDDRPVVADLQPKSIGHEETFAVDHRDHGVLRREIVRMSDSVASRLRASHLAGRTLTLKVRFADFSTITRSHSVPTPFRSGAEIARVAGTLLAAVEVSPGVRLVGVSVSTLEPEESAGGRQLVLAGLEDQLGEATDTGALGTGGGGFDPEAGEQRREVEITVDEIRRRYGAKAVGPAAAVGESGLRVKSVGDSQWGPDAPEAAPTAPEAAPPAPEPAPTAPEPAPQPAPAAPERAAETDAVAHRRTPG